MKYATISTRNLFHFCYRFFLVNIWVLILTTPAEALSVSPILDYMASHAPSYLESDHAKYTLTTDQGENTHFILINGTKYYYTPAEQTAEQNNYLVFLTGTALTQTGATSENYVFTDGTNYYTFDTSNLPSSSYILTTEGANEDDYNIKIIKGEDTTYYTFDLKDSAITKNGLVTLTPSTAEDYTIAVALPYDEYYEYDEDYNEYHFISTPNTTKYYKMSIDQSKASHVGGKISWSGILSEFSDDYWQDLQDDGYYTWSDDNISGSNTIVDTTAKTVSGAIRLKTASNGNSPNYWNNHVTYTYTAPNNYDIASYSNKINEVSVTDPNGSYPNTYKMLNSFTLNNPDNTTISITNKVFANNKYTGTVISTTTAYKEVEILGGAISNTGTITKMIADFIGNSLVGNIEGSQSANVTIYTEGGAIYNSGSKATIASITGDFISNSVIASNCTFGDAFGGAIYNNYAAINTITGDFISNSAIGSSFAEGGAIYNSGSNVTIASITGDFINNSAILTNSPGDASGGAIYNFAASTGSIVGNFINNTAESNSDAYGGAIYNAGTIKTITGDFISNSANSTSTYSNGGAIYNINTIGSITGDFISNRAIATNNSGYAYGGAIYNDGTVNTITGNFINNHITVYNGYAYGGAIYNDGTVNTITGNFINNRITVRSGGTLSGAALYNSGTITSVVGDFINNITKSLQSNNPAPSSGGAIYNSGKIGSLTGDFINNSVTLSSYNYGTVKSEGGAIYNATSATISSITGDFINNSASSGGAIYNFGNISSITGNFINNISNDNGNDRWSKAFGGAIYNGGIINSITGDFVNNSAEGNNQYSSVYGGAIYNSGANAVIDSITGNFINNNAQSYSVLGGVIYNTSSATINSITGDFINNKFITTGNQSSISGGVIYNGSTIGSITGDFISNKATKTDSSDSINGGVIYNFGSIDSINGKFINNSAAGTSNKRSNGGIIYNNRTINSIAGEFTSNTIANSNGIIYNSGTNATISDINSDFISNNITGTSYGGIIYNYSSASIDSISGDFTNNVITGSSVNGGIIYNNSSATITTINSDFTNNVITGSSVNGGIIYNNNPATITTIDSDFTNNKATGSSVQGGAIYIFSSKINNIEGNFTSNSAISTNSSGKAYGGAIHLTGTGANIGSIIGDFTDNSVTVTTGSSYSTLEAKGGAIYSYSGASIGSISGNFTGNYVSAINTSTNLGTTVAGGAIFHNEGTIGSITADFTSNSATSSLNAYGGAIYNYSRINSIAGDFTGNNVTVTNSSGKAYGGAIYSGRLYANFPSYYQGGVQLTLAGNTFTDNYVQIGETITPNSIYNAGEINIADSATVTINDGYDGLSQAQLNIGNNSIFNLSVDNGILQTDNLGTVTNNGSINWDMDADLLAADSDKITVTSLSGTQSVLIRAINLLNDKEGITDILLTENDTLKSAYTLSSAINDSIFSPNDYIYTVSYNSENGILTFNGIDPVTLLGDATIDTINKQSREYLKLGADNHAVYTDLVTEKDDDHPDAVIIAGTTYYFSAAESTDEMTAIVRNLAATGADALREVNSNEDYIFNINDKYYTYATKKLPVSAWFKGDGTEDGYDYYDYADDNTTKQYYTFALKDSAITKNGLVTFTSSTAEDYDLSITLPNGTKYYKAAVDMSKTSHLGNKAAWSDILTTAPESYTWADDNTPSSNVFIDLGAKTVSGAIRMKSSHNGETPETWNNWQTFTYTAPADYELIQTRVSSIDADGSNVKNKVFVGISGSQDGGAIYNTTSLPTVDIVADFINNSNVASSSMNASSYGGAIYNENASIRSIAGDFINNRATNPSQYTKGTFMGGAIYNFNGTIDSIVGDFISNSVAPGSTNYYNKASGSAIANVGKNAEIKSIMGSFINNFAKGSTVYGGVIYNYGTIGSINGDFINNRAEAGTITGAVIYNNDSVIGTITGDFINNSSNNNGGAIYNSGTNAIISSVIGDFINNKLGLVIYNDSGAHISTITGDFINNTSHAIYNNATIGTITGDFISNNSTLQGGAIFNSSGTIKSITGDFINNSITGSSDVYGGAIYSIGTDATIGNITGDFINNSAEGSNAYGGAIFNYRDSIIASITGDFISNSAKATNYYASGGAIYNSSSNATIGSITGNFNNNSATGFYVYGGAIYNSGSNATINSITGNFNNNSATGFYTYGGAIYNTNYAGIGSITGDFINNSITGSSYASGGAINNSGSNATINSITGNFISNRATSNNYASGGAIYNSASNAAINSITGDFIDNQATTSINAGYGEGFAPASGGAIYNSGSNGTIGTITGDFINNIAKSVNSAAYGGAINNRGIITTIEGDFINNNAITSGAEANIAQGGAVYNLAGTIGSITGNFNNNSATGTYAYGGAIHNTFTIGIISGDFIANSVKATKYSAYGGAISNSGELTITGDFINNSASAIGWDASARGGAIHNAGNYYANKKVIITGNFVSNSAISTNSSAFGGAINNEGGYSVINNVTGNFENNKAKGDYAFGGAVSNNGGAITITGDFINNSAESFYYAYGGAIFNGEVDFDTFEPIVSSEAIITLTGNTFAGNYIDSPQIPNSIYNAGIINIAEGATVTINDGWQSINGAQLIMGENSTLNMNIANGILQNDSLGMLTKNGTINTTVDVNFSTNKADTIATTSVTLTDGIKFVTLNDINILDDISNVTKDTKVRILKTQANGLELALSDTLQARLAAMDEIFIGAVDGTGFTIVDDVATQTDWSHKYQKHITADELSFGKLGLATTYTKNDSLGIIETRRAGGETADVNLPDDTLKLVNTADIGNRSFDATIDSEAYTVIEDLGETAAGIFAINGISGGELETINLNGKRGFDLANATTLELNNVKLTGNDTLATVENANAVINLNNAEVDGDIVSTTGYTMGLSGDNILTGNVGEASMTISSGSLKINDETLKDASLNTTGGTIILTDDGVKNYKIGSLTSSENAVYNIDFDITDIDNPIADTITANGFGTIKLGLFNLSGNISDLPIDMIDKPFIVQILKDSDADLELVISEDAQSELGNNKYELAQTTHNRDDVVVAENTWDKVYNHKTQDEIFLGTIGLATTVNENDSIGITLNGESYLKDIVVGEKIGDTLKLVNQLDTAEEKTFDATADGETYTVSEDVGESKGALSIDGKGGTIDFAGYEAFEKIGTDTLVSLKDVTLTGAKGDIANVEGGTLTAKDTVIDGTMGNSGIVELTNSTVGNIINNGLMEINSEVTLGEVSGTGITNINADITLTEAIRGNTVNVKEASLSGANKLGSDVTLNALGATINIENNEVKVKNANFDATSTLALKINSLEDHGLLTAENIDIAEGAKLQATLAQGLATVGKTSTVRLLSAKNIDFNNFADSYDNNMYHFEKADKNGLYNISLVKTAEDVAKETEGENWVSDAASAWVDGKAFADDTITAAVADKLADLAQNNAERLVEEVKKIAPTETTAVLAETTENTNRLFKIVDAYLRGEQSQMGFASGDNLEDVTIWGRVYIGESKISKRGITAGSDANSRGAILSIEKKLDKSFKLGVGAQFDTTDIKAYSRKTETNTTVGFVYSEYKPDKWFINSVASYGYSKFDESKYALGTHYDSEYNVHMSSLAAMFGYEFDVFTPEAGLRYYHIKQEGYTDALGQSIKDDKIDILRAVAGIRMKKDFGRFRPEAYVGLTYDIHSDKGNTTVNLANGSSYTVPGKRLNKLGYETSIGVEAKITDNISASVSYIGAYRDSYQEHTGMFNIKYNF